MQAATDRGITVWPWTFYESDINKAFLTCPDGLTTDDAQWATDMIKFMEATTPSPVIKAGTTTDMAVNAVTYGGESTALSADDLMIKVIDGEEFVTVDGTTVTAVADGTATVLYGHKATTTDGSEYVLYAQPVTITVGDPVVEEPAVEKGNDLVSILLIVGAIVIGAGVIVGAAIFIKPKKQ